MSRYRGPRLRITRRLGELPGLTQKSSSKQNPPGQHGAIAKKPSQYSIRLQEKQKLRFHYGVSEHQLIGIVKKARRQVGSTGERVLQFLEMRLDTIIFRAGFAPTLRAARQLVNHGHVKVNSRYVTIPSFQMKPGDKFYLDGSIQKLVESKGYGITAGSAGSYAPKLLPPHIEFTMVDRGAVEREDIQNKKGGLVKQIIGRQDVSCPVDEFLIIEYYSRKI
jgi:small subunit ribosomal protein S4